MPRRAVAVSQSPSRLERRVVAAAEATLAREQSVSPLDVLTQIGWLPLGLVDDWRRGRVDYLERVAAVQPDRLTAALGHLRRWAAREGLKPNEVAYVAATRDPRPLRFTADGDRATERPWRTNWTPPDLSAAARQRLTHRQSKAPDLVVIEPPRQAGKPPGGGGGPLHPLPQALRAAGAPGGGGGPGVRRGAVPCRRGRALGAANGTGSGASTRTWRSRLGLAEAVVRLFPGCPSHRAEAIARHAGTRGSGRVGRSAAGRALDEQAITLAVVASVRHQDTDYDALLMTSVPRTDAREQVQPDIDRVLTAWRNPHRLHREARRRCGHYRMSG
jgi:hypothetical protein